VVFVAITQELFKGATRAISQMQGIVYVDAPDTSSPQLVKPVSIAPI